MSDVEKLMNETHEHYRLKMDSLHGELRRLRKDNKKLKAENRELKRQKKKEHYRNGQKRGRTRNG